LPGVTWPELNELLDYAADLDGPRAGNFAAVNTTVGVEGTKMANYFSAERIAELNAGHREVYRQFRELQERFFLRTYKSERGAEYAKHGFCRRLETLVRTIDQVYELLPPQQEKIPDRDNVVDGTIAIQAFTMNAFGCLENIAWVWLYEKNVKNDDGTDFDPMDVGLGKKKLRKALTQQFRDYLDRKRDWRENLIEFRDSLAHRIPLFIPPCSHGQCRQIQGVRKGKVGGTRAKRSGGVREGQSRAIEALPVHAGHDALDIRGGVPGRIPQPIAQRLRHDRRIRPYTA